MNSSLSLPQGYRWDDSLKQGDETARLSSLVWPNYLILESDIPEPGLKFEISEAEFMRRFPVWGIRRSESGELVAYMNAVQLSVDLSADDLPDSGWRFAIQSAGSKQKPNCLCLLVANVDPNARGLGLSQLLINRAKQATLDLGFDTMIAPVRPTLKHNSPLISMKEYISKQTDPWINMHCKSGGRIANICSESVLIKASLPKWREWTGLPLLTAGEKLLPGGLAPLRVDIEKNIGTYCEPNVWIRYDF